MLRGITVLTTEHLPPSWQDIGRQLMTLGPWLRGVKAVYLILSWLSRNPSVVDTTPPGIASQDWQEEKRCRDFPSTHYSIFDLGSNPPTNPLPVS